MKVSLSLSLDVYVYAGYQEFLVNSARAHNQNPINKLKLFIKYFEIFWDILRIHEQYRKVINFF